MNWNIFSPAKRVRKRGKAKDSFDTCIQVIETFAPREHLSSREIFYYNYKMMPSNRKSLGLLLETLAQNKRLKTDPGEHARTLFLHLKDFYDPKETLALVEALCGQKSYEKVPGSFRLFYNKKKITREEIEGWLKSLETK